MAREQDGVEICRCSVIEDCTITISVVSFANVCDRNAGMCILSNVLCYLNQVLSTAWIAKVEK
jgi:hypothetical protein